VAGNNVINAEFVLSTGVSDTTIKSDGGSLELAGPIHCGGNSRILRLEGTNSVLNIVSGVISNGTGTAVTRLWKRFGVNTWMLTSSNSYTDSTFLGNNLSSSPYVNDGFLRLAHNNAIGTGGLIIYGGYQAGGVQLVGDITVANAIALYGRQGQTYPAIKNVSGTNTLTGNINVTANGARLNLETAAGQLTISGAAMTGSSGRVLTLRGAGTGVFAKDITSVVVGSLDKYDAGTWILSGNNNYTGNTTISAGTVSITGTSGASPVNVTGGTLTGTGIINGPVTIGNGGTLNPGVSTNPGETLTVNNNLSLAGIALMQIGTSGGAPVNDSIVGITNITYGGTLLVTNATGASLADGDAFVLFSASGTVTGDFTNIEVEPPVVGLNPSFDAANGTLTFTNAVVAPPTLTYTNLGDGVLEFSFDNNSKLVWQTNTLEEGLSTNWMDYPDVSNPVQVTNDLSIPASVFGLAPK
jgi:autotransporter-associated beta strand protein